MSLSTETTDVFSEMFSDFCRDVATEDGSIVFEKLSGTNAPEELFTVTEYELDSADAYKKQLPPDVQMELRINESNLASADILQASSVKHVTDARTIRYALLRPAGYFPTRFNRLWTFWLSSAELVEAVSTGFRIIDDAGNFLVDDAANPVIWDGV